MVLVVDHQQLLDAPLMKNSAEEVLVPSPVMRISKVANVAAVGVIPLYAAQVAVGVALE